MQCFARGWVALGVQGNPVFDLRANPTRSYDVEPRLVGDVNSVTDHSENAFEHRRNTQDAQSNLGVAKEGGAGGLQRKSLPRGRGLKGTQRMELKAARDAMRNIRLCSRTRSAGQ